MYYVQTLIIDWLPLSLFENLPPYSLIGRWNQLSSLMMNIINLYEVSTKSKDVGIIVVMVIQILTVLLGFFGAYKENRSNLITFALIVTISWIVALILSRDAYIVGNVTVNVVTVLLALWQAHMIRDLTSPNF